jgi:hypothetical protein
MDSDKNLQAILNDLDDKNDSEAFNRSNIML